MGAKEFVIPFSSVHWFLSLFLSLPEKKGLTKKMEKELEQVLKEKTRLCRGHVIRVSHESCSMDELPTDWVEANTCYLDNRSSETQASILVLLSFPIIIATEKGPWINDEQHGRTKVFWHDRQYHWWIETSLHIHSWLWQNRLRQCRPNWWRWFHLSRKGVWEKFGKEKRRCWHGDFDFEGLIDLNQDYFL